MHERAPAGGIAEHRERLRALQDEAVLATIRASDPLPQGGDEDPEWEDERTWDRAEFVIAAADEIGERRLVEGIGPLFELAALGDTFEMMQGIRHGPERAVEPEYHLLVPIMLGLVGSKSAGCRRWATRELGLLRDPASVDHLLDITQDREEWVRQEACTSLYMVAPSSSVADQLRIVRRLREISTTDPSELVRDVAAERLGSIEQ